MQNGGDDHLTNTFGLPDARPVSIRGMLAARLDFPVELTCGRNHDRGENG
jgi:hypothetical protein